MQIRICMKTNERTEWNSCRNIFTYRALQRVNQLIAGDKIVIHEGTDRSCEYEQGSGESFSEIRFQCEGIEGASINRVRENNVQLCNLAFE